MNQTEREALDALLAQMRTLQGELTSYNAGISTLHMEAAIAALESQLRRHSRPSTAYLRVVSA